MTILNSGEQMEVLTHVEKCLSSVKWGELADPLNDSARISRALLHLSTLFPALEACDNGIRQNAHRIFDNNIRVISIIFQFHAKGLSEEDVSKVYKMATFLPKLETAANLSCAVLTELKPNSEFDQNLTHHLRNITDVMNYVRQILQLFKLTFFTCNEDSFYSQDFASAASELKEIVTMLEFKSVAAYKQTSGNSLLTVLFNMLDRPFKIAMSALWLLFAFPAVENVKLDIILGLCQCAVQIFVLAVNMMNSLTQLLLKDFVRLNVERDELLKTFQEVNEYCAQVLELTPCEASVLIKLGNREAVNVLKGATCESFNISEETQNNSALKVMVNLNGTQCNDVDMSDKVQEISVIKPAEHFEGTLNFCGNNSDTVGIPKQARKTSAKKLSVEVKDKKSSSDVFSEETPEISAQKSAMNSATVPVNFYTPNLNIVDVSEETQKIVAPKSPMVVKDTQCANVAIFKESLKTSELKAAVNLEIKACNGVSVLKELQRTIVLKSTENLIVTQNFCDSNFNTVVTSKGALKSSTSKSLVSMKNTNCMSVEVLKKTQNTCVFKSAVNENDGPVPANLCYTNTNIVGCAKETLKSAVLKSTCRVNNATYSCDRNVLCASSSFFDLWDFKTDTLTLKQRKTLNKVIKSYKYHVDNLSFSVKIVESELRVFCKICNQTSVAKNIDKHLEDECRPQKRVTRNCDSQKHLEKESQLQKRVTKNCDNQNHLENECQPQKRVKKNCDNQNHLQNECQPQKSVTRNCDSQKHLENEFQPQKGVTKNCNNQNHLENECQPQKRVKKNCDNQNHLENECRPQKGVTKNCDSQKHLQNEYQPQKSVTRNCDSQKHLENECQPQKGVTKNCDSQKHLENECQPQNHVTENCDNQNHLENECQPQNGVTKNCDNQNHLENECQPQKGVTKNCDNQNAHAAILINEASSAPLIQLGSGVWYLDITDLESDSLAPKQKEILQELIEKTNRHTNHFSFGVRVVKSELQAVGCKFCDVAFLPENIEEHINDLNHRQSVYRNCKESREIRAAVPQISAGNWEFLQVAPGEQHLCLCRLCGKKIGLSVNAWIQHFHSSLHYENLRKC